MKTTLAATLLTMLLALGSLPACGAEAAAPPHAVPMVHATDLFRPHHDPDDHWDLACVYALAFQGRIDLKGVLIDFPPPALHTDPDVSAVAQLNYLTGQAVPALVGASRTFSRDQARDAALQADLRRIRAVLEILRQSPQPLVLNVVGSTRDIAIAGELEPELFATKCASIYLNAGSGSPDKAKAERLEYNVSLDPASYAAIFRLPCPVYWMPCFEDAGEFHVAEFGTFYQFRQDLVLPHLSDRLQNFFAFMYQRGPQANWLQYVLAPKEAPLLAQQGTLSRNMWCTAGFLHAAGLAVSRDGRILPQAEASDAVFSFDPIRIQCAPNGVTQWAPDATAKNRFIFHVRDLQHYQSAMISALHSLLTQLP